MKESPKENPSLLDRLRIAEVERAICDLRRGLPVALFGKPGQSGILAAAAELIGTETISLMQAWTRSDLHVILTGPRAATLKIRQYTEPLVAVPLPPEDTVARVHALADPSLDLARPLQGPFEAERALPDLPFTECIQLAKAAELLPAVVTAPLRVANFREWAHTRRLSALTAEAVMAFPRRSAETLELVTTARLPLSAAEDTRILAFRSKCGGPDHFAILIGRPEPGTAILTRIHSQCFTGDLLGSLKCDCGEQLKGALQRIAQEGAGALLYLSQEGRGIGLVNKLRAYKLQDQGFDTAEANERLGFEVDERAFQPAAQMLVHMGFPRIRLLTNNPSKVTAMESHGIAVAERVPHQFPANPHNEGYLRIKAEKTGHIL